MWIMFWNLKNIYQIKHASWFLWTVNIWWVLNLTWRIYLPLDGLLSDSAILYSTENCNGSLPYHICVILSMKTISPFTTMRKASFQTLELFTNMVSLFCRSAKMDDKIRLQCNLIFNNKMIIINDTDSTIVFIKFIKNVDKGLYIDFNFKNSAILLFFYSFIKAAS